MNRFVLLIAGCCLVIMTSSALAQEQATRMKGWLIEARSLLDLDPQDTTEAGLRQLVVAVQDAPSEGQLKALATLVESGLELWYWIEIARDESMARQHPEWMSSIQGHPEWRRFHPAFPKVKENEIVKVYPWVPVFYEEALQAHLQKVNQLLRQWPAPHGIFLNDLQGAPTACGCGHPLCRWTSDYGPKKSATRLGHDAPARFLKSIKQAHPTLACIPVWATECEAHDKDALCAGVGCYQGACWREWSKQLAPVAESCPSVAALLTYKELQRDLTVYGEPAGWIPRAIESFAKESSRFQHPPIHSNRLIGILQGWDVSPAEIEAQIRHIEQSDTRGYILSKMPIHADWEPRLLRLDRPGDSQTP